MQVVFHCLILQSSKLEFVPMCKTFTICLSGYRQSAFITVSITLEPHCMLDL
jgi:hypothetical protein